MQEILQLPEAAMGPSLVRDRLQSCLLAMALTACCASAALTARMVAVARAVGPAASLAAQGGLLAAFALGFGDFAAQVQYSSGL